MRKLILFLIMCLGLMFSAFSQQADSTHKSKIFTKKNIVIGAIVYQQITGALIEYAWWWQDSLRSFHFEKDNFFHNYSLGLDKVGHFYISYLAFTAINEAMRWAEFTSRQRLLIATLVPAFWAFSIEFGDAISPYGFSWQDMTANLAGVGFGLLQEKVPYFQNFTLKFSFWPTEVYWQKFPKRWAPTSDYNAHAYWLSMNIHNILPKSIGRYWPECINLAAGYSIDKYGGANMHREFLFGIDINLRAIKTKSAGATALRNVLNLIHLPSPGVKVTKEFTPNYQILLKN